MLKGMFCMRLHTAGTVIGWLGSIGSILLIIVLSSVLINVDTIVCRISTNDHVDPDAAHMMIVTVCSIGLAIVLLNFLSSALLILGTMKNRHLFLLPWLINSGIALVFSVIQSLVVLALLAQSAPAAPILMYIMMSGLGLALNIYIYYAILSLFKHIQNIRDQESRVVLQPQVAHHTESYPNYVKL
ncbi:uncharacterized protein Dwil_GK27541 [Drosophila willistoni]|uniref:MARVEL domain-containing protein n=1 Tax=Drosophila willistoni TaxID=7260 RepID=A0A0Q9WNS0_DROWI|nr:uncharacterized protein LOC26529543 [Drosophila willistoni]KRF97577.1 uncharacterized protein Dwil_GK27541 [Drosophila willistoni]